MELDPVPEEFIVPNDVQLEPSSVDTKRTGAWCIKAIKEGTKYGPYKGRTVSEPEDEMDPTFVWEIIDPETDETTFYVDATDPKDGCWLRFINCARFFEEQNLVSEQIGMDIYYRVIKDISPGEELLTWYEKTPLKKKKSAMKNAKSKKGLVSSRARSRSTSPEPKESAQETDHVVKMSPLKPVNGKRHKRSAAAKASRFLDEVRRCERLTDNFGGEDLSDSDPEIDTRSIPESTNSSMSQAISEQGLGPALPAKPGEYQFEMLQQHIVRSKSGKKMFKCDICSGEYKHAFSLKRHYIRNHINFKFVCPADALNCKINLELQDAQTRKLRILYGIEDNNKCLVEDAAAEDVKSGEESDDTIITEYQNPQDLDSELADEDKQTESTKNNGNSCDKLVSENTVSIPTVSESAKDDNENKLQDKDEQMDDVSPAAQKDSLDVDNDDDTDTAKKTDCGMIDEHSSKNLIPEHDTTTQPDSKATTDTPIKVEVESIASSDGGQPSLDCEQPAGEGDGEQPSSAFNGDTVHNMLLSGLYRCGICSMLFDAKEDLANHLMNHPEVPNMKTYKCHQCDMKFPHRQNLARHLAVHTGNKPYSCRFCGKRFPTGTNQKRHERIHLGRRVACEFCSSTFSQTGDLKKHVRKLHPEFFNECAFCGKYFSDPDTLEDHLTDIHQQSVGMNSVEATRRTQVYKVDVESDMAESMKLAENKVGFKFACTICKKRFNDYANMCRHRRLAHQRPILGHHVPNSKFNDHPLQSYDDDYYLDPQNVFYANISRNIADNIKYYVEGKREHLEDANDYIKYNDMSQDWNVDTPNLSDQESEILSLYNFPKGANLKPKLIELASRPPSSLSSMPSESMVSPKEDTSHNGDYDEVESLCDAQSVLSDQEMVTPIPAHTNLPIRVPRFQTCNKCHAVFLEFATYAKHMWDRHKTSIPWQGPSSSAIGEIQKPKPAHDNRITHSISRFLDDVDKPKSRFGYKNSEKHSSRGNPLKKESSKMPVIPLDLSSSTRYPYTKADKMSVNDADIPLDFSVLPTQSGAIANFTKSSYDSVQDTGYVFPGTEAMYNSDNLLCDVCHQVFGSSMALEEHTNFIHAGIISTSVPVEEPTLIPPPQYFVPSPTGQLQVRFVPLIAPDEMSYNCTKCNQKFATVESLHNHILDCADVGKPSEPPVTENPTSNSLNIIKYKKFHTSSSELGYNAVYRDIFRKKKKVPTATLR